MQLREQVEEIVRTIALLPAEKVVELQDFARFLKERYGQGMPAEFQTEWTDEDLRDLSQAVWQYAEQTMPWDGKPDGSE